MNKTIHTDDAMQMMLAQMQVLGIDPAEFAEFAERGDLFRCVSVS